MNSIRKMILLFFSLVSLAAGAVPTEPLSAQLKEGDSLVVTSENGLNVRIQPNASRVGAIPSGATAIATGAAQRFPSSHDPNAFRDWAPVKFQSDNGDWVEGWILLDYVQIAPEPAAEAAAVIDPAPAPSAVTELTVRTKGAATFRAGPGRTSQSLGDLPEGTRVSILGRPIGNWIPIQKVGGEEKGFMHTSLLEAEGDLNPLEVAALSPTDGADIEDQLNGDEDDDSHDDDHSEDASTEAEFDYACHGPDCRNPGLDRLPEVNEHGFARPVPGIILRGFGRHTDPVNGQRGKMHKGVDFRAAVGTPVRAASGGRIVEIVSSCRVGQTRCGGRWGNYIVVDHGDGLMTRYAHLSAIDVKVGDQVTASQVIGETGSTGRVSGPHLHFEILKDGVQVDPASYLTL